MRASDPHLDLMLEFEYSWRHSPAACYAELSEEEYNDRYFIDLNEEILYMQVLKID